MRRGEGWVNPAISRGLLLEISTPPPVSGGLGLMLALEKAAVTLFCVLSVLVDVCAYGTEVKKVAYRYRRPSPAAFGIVPKTLLGKVLGSRPAGVYSLGEARVSSNTRTR